MRRMKVCLSHMPNKVTVGSLRETPRLQRSKPSGTVPALEASLGFRSHRPRFRCRLLPYPSLRRPRCMASRAHQSGLPRSSPSLPSRRRCVFRPELLGRTNTS